MKEIKLKILSPYGNEANIEVPNDISVKDFINELIIALSLPTIRHDGTQIEYRLDSKGLGRHLSDNETLASAKVESHDKLILMLATSAGGSSVEAKKSRISIKSIGLADDLAAIDVKSLISNELALTMTLHSYCTTLSQLEDERQNLEKAKSESAQFRDKLEQLHDKLKEKNIATVLLISGQVFIGFGTNLVTSNSTGGWFVFLSGLVLNLAALYISFFGIRTRLR